MITRNATSTKKIVTKPQPVITAPAPAPDDNLKTIAQLLVALNAKLDAHIMESDNVTATISPVKLEQAANKILTSNGVSKKDIRQGKVSAKKSNATPSIPDNELCLITWLPIGSWVWYQTNGKPSERILALLGKGGLGHGFKPKFDHTTVKWGTKDMAQYDGQPFRTIGHPANLNEFIAKVKPFAPNFDKNVQ